MFLFIPQSDRYFFRGSRTLLGKHRKERIAQARVKNQTRQYSLRFGKEHAPSVQPSEIAGAVSEFFPDIDTEILSLAAKRYIDLGVWGKDPHLPREGFERLRDSLISGGLIKIKPDFEDCVQNQFADALE